MASAPPRSFFHFPHSLKLPQDLDEHRHGHTHPSAFNASLDSPALLIRHPRSSWAVLGAQELSLPQFSSLRWAPRSSLQPPRPGAPPGPPRCSRGPSDVHDAVGRVAPDGVRDHLGSRLPDAVPLQAGRDRELRLGHEAEQDPWWGQEMLPSSAPAAGSPCARPTPCGTLRKGILL